MDCPRREFIIEIDEMRVRVVELLVKKKKKRKKKRKEKEREREKTIKGRIFQH